MGEERKTRREERRRAILDAAMKIFSAKGYSAATIRAIAREAGVAEGTIYLYFSGKRDLLLGLYRSLIVDSLEDLLARPRRRDDEAFLRELVADRMRRIRAHAGEFKFGLTELPLHPDLRQRFYAEILRPQLDRLEAFARERVRAGAYRSVRPRVAARALQGMYLSFAIAEILFGDADVAALDPEGLAEELVSIFLFGVTPRSGPPRAASAPGNDRREDLETQP